MKRGTRQNGNLKDHHGLAAWMLTVPAAVREQLHTHQPWCVGQCQGEIKQCCCREVKALVKWQHQAQKQIRGEHTQLENKLQGQRGWEDVY